MELPSLILLSLVVLYSFYSVEGRLFCFRRLKKRGMCGGHLRKHNYATPEDCCRGKGLGFAIQKQKKGRNRFLCTPCANLSSSTIPVPSSNKPSSKKHEKSSQTFQTTSLPPYVNDVIQPELKTTTIKVDDWPKPETGDSNKFGYSYPRYDDDDEAKKVQWSEWSPCSATCGAGWRSRFKICDGCDKNDYENVLSRPCMINFYCSEDGNWGPWFPWQPCSKSCNGGTRIRQRKCNYPPPAYGGAICPGPATNTEECNEQLCPVDGGWSDWSEFTLCSATCGPGNKQRVRSCSNPTPANGGRDCAGPAVMTRRCELTKCPQDGDWSLWSEWSHCTVTCGQGVRTRSRDCDSPRPMRGGKDCEGEAVQTTPCSHARPCPVHGGWSDWDDYGFCQALRCDWGFRIRTRLCTNPRPQHGGAHCHGNQYERKECFNNQDCPRNGSWCAWSEWSPCSATCAEQTSLQVRQRTCTCPEPRFGGNDCEGDSLEVRDCTDLPFCHPATNTSQLGAAGHSSARNCREGEVDGSGADEECDQEVETEEAGTAEPSRAG